MSERPLANGALQSMPGSEVEKVNNGDGDGLARKDNTKSFSWLDPHPIFVVILVGPQEQPFGMQKDFLCSRSEHYRKIFADSPVDETIEHIVRLPNTTKEVFGLAQNFLFTGKVIMEPNHIPSYEHLIALWRLGYDLGIDGLCEKSLSAMTDCRRLTQRIPAPPLIIQVWKDTPEGSTIRRLLLSWAAEYMRSSDARAEFAKSLPQEVLSELVVTMSSFDNAPLVQAAVPPPRAVADLPKKNVHYLEDASDEQTLNNTKRNRLSGGISSLESIHRRGPRDPLLKPQKRRSSGAYVGSQVFTTAQKLSFCADLLSRMLSGPGFWTRLVGPFKEPVDPQQDGVPDYFDKVKRPMDLGTIKDKMDRNEYGDEEEFLTDVRQIFDNCFKYWKKGDPMWNAGEKLQKSFEDKYAGMNKWLSKMEGDEGD